MEPKKSFLVHPLTPPRPDLKKMLHSLRYYYRHRQSKVKGPAYQLINQSTIMCSLFKITNIKFFYYPWQLYFTLPYLDLLLPSTTHTHHPPPNLSRLQCASPHGLVNCLGKSPRGFLHFFISFPGSCKTVLSYQTTVFSSKKSNTEKAKSKKKRSDGLGRQTSAACPVYLSFLPYMFIVCYHHHEIPIKYI